MVSNMGTWIQTLAWSATVSTLSAAARLSFPAEVRARTLSIYLFVMSGGYAAGSLFRGQVADRFGVRLALGAAGACVLADALVLVTGSRRNPLSCPLMSLLIAPSVGLVQV